MSERIFSFEPVVDANCRLLVLGTMPSVQSLSAGFYYAHPRNAFWRIMAEVFSCDFPQTAEERKRLALSHHVALWDVARSCVREGSLDANMRAVALNEFSDFFARYPAIRQVLLNGGTAWKLYHRLPGEVVSARECLLMPSTSPAHTLAYEKKLAAWRAVLMGGQGCEAAQGHI